MRIAITGANGSVGKLVTKRCLDRGHYVVKIDLPDTRTEDEANTEFFAVDVANDYDGLKDAFKGADAVFHFAGIPCPLWDPPATVYAVNSNASFNALHAAGALGIKRVCQASSANAMGLLFSEQPLVFDSFPIDENHRPHVSDAYAFSKVICEAQAEAMLHWFPNTSIASLRFHHVSPRGECRKTTDEHPELGPRELWSWVSPEAVARACLLCVEGEHFTGHEVFNIVAPTLIYDGLSTVELAKEHYPSTKLNNLQENGGFWSIEKAKRILGWDHPETE